MSHPTQTARRRRKALAARVRIPNPPENWSIKRAVEQCRVGECWLRRYNNRAWHRLQLLINAQVKPYARVGYSHQDKWNRVT